MINYRSTRGDKKLYSFSEVLLKGIADDGGLFVPEKLPQFTNKDLELLLNKSYQEIASFIFNLFETDFSDKLIKKIVDQAYSSNFDNKKIAPIFHLKNNQYILELWHGPTSAFKDMALQIMPLFFVEAIKKSDESLNYLILVATSGDTGKAALEGYKNKENISIIVFYPKDNVSKLQELQMTTQEGNNVTVYAINGDFDDAQKLVKEIFNDKKFNEELKNKYKTVLSSANSINWGRLIPQIIYYINGYLDLVNSGIIKLGYQIDVVVPSGNFGNILAAFYAKKMGLPIRKLICASNENNVLTDFLKTGIYDITNRSLIKTPSPAMDILVSSNLERLLYIISNDANKISIWMNELKTNRKFEVDNETKNILQNEFYADYVTNKDCLQNVKQIFYETKYLIDPHTSVAQIVAERYIKQNNVLTPVLICSTAHWAKFAKDVHSALFPDKSSTFFHEVLNPREKNNDNNPPSKLRDFQKVLDKICSLDKNIYAPQSLKELEHKKQIYTEIIDANTTSAKDIILKKLK